MLDWERAAVWALALGICIGFWAGVIFTIIEVVK